MTRILVLNAGSSTLKASALDVPGRNTVAAETIDWGADATRAAARRDDLARLLERFAVGGVPTDSIEVVGHRVVHGGTRFVAPTLVDDAVLAALDQVAELAPLHNPVAVDTIRAARAELPDVPHVAAFDTAFHATLPPAAHEYPLPRDWVERYRIRRYGFHGLSVEWSVRRAAELLRAEAASLALVVAHLGSGCSVTAVDAGRSVSTSMGMTPLEGLMMGTRSGSVDPGILLRLLDAGVSPAELADGLDHRSGLVGVAGTSDMRALVEREAGGDERAALAIELFVRRAAEGIAAAATSLPHLDGLVFTAGIGEHAVSIRQRIVARLAALGVTGRLAGAAEEADAVLTPAAQRPAILVVAAREDLVIAEAAVAIG